MLPCIFEDKNIFVFPETLSRGSLRKFAKFSESTATQVLSAETLIEESNLPLRPPCQNCRQLSMCRGP